MASSSKKSAAAKANLLGKRKAEDDLETKPVLRKHKEKETTKGRVELLETKSDLANLSSVKETVEGLDETPDSVEDAKIQEAAVPEKTLFVYHLSPETGISDLINFFKDVGEVVRVQLVVNTHMAHRCAGFVEFASANDAIKARQEKKGEYLHYRQVFTRRATYRPHKFRYRIDHKVWYKDYLQRESLPIKKHETPPAFAEEVLFVANLSPQTTTIDHIISFFRDVGEVVGVRLFVDHKGNYVGCGFVEFASVNEARRALEKKNQYLHDDKILLIKGLDETSDSVAVADTKLFVAHLSRQTEISDIIRFIKDGGEVVHVRLIADYGFVEFGSAIEAKALHEKNSEDLHRGKIVADVVKTVPYPPRPKYCIDLKVWYEEYEDYLRQESLLIEEDAAVEGLDESPDFVEEAALPKKTLYVGHLSPRTEISDIIKFFKDVGEVVRVRLTLDYLDKYVGCGFVEFASSNEAKKALEKKNGEYLHNHKIFLDDVATKRATYPPPKYCLDHKVWYKDNLQRESLATEKDETPPAFVEEVLFVANLSPQTTKIYHIIDFFRDVGKVVGVRLVVDCKGKNVGYGFVEFASANEAKRALELKNGEYLADHKILLMKGLDETPDSVEVAAVRKKTLLIDHPFPHIEISDMYCIDHNVRYEDYVRRESLMIEEDAAEEGLDETPDFGEEVAVRKKTLFITTRFDNIRISKIIKVLKKVEVVGVRFIVNDMGEHVGCAFVEFASADDAKKALQKDSRIKHKISRHRVAKIAPYPFRPKYILAEKLWNEDCLRRFSSRKITFSDDDW